MPEKPSALVDGVITIGIMATLSKTVAGLERARAQGRIGGRPRKVCDRAGMVEMRQQGMSYGAIGKRLGVPRSTVHRIVEGLR